MSIEDIKKCLSVSTAQDYKRVSLAIEDVYEMLAQLASAEGEVERLKPKPLLFDTIGGFKIIISDDVPEGQIWFATDAQLKKALEYSATQIEKALESTHIKAQLKATNHGDTE